MSKCAPLPPWWRGLAWQHSQHLPHRATGTCMVLGVPCGTLGIKDIRNSSVMAFSGILLLLLLSSVWLATGAAQVKGEPNTIHTV